MVVGELQWNKPIFMNCKSLLDYTHGFLAVA